MANPATLFFRRLGSTEADTWSQILQKVGTASPAHYNELFKSVFVDQDTTFFAASVGGELVGGSGVFRDRKRLGMAVLSLVLSPSYRESVAEQMIKSSIPFFKTLAIRKIDALVRTSNDQSRLLLPFSQELQPWCIPYLEDIGFEEEMEVFAHRFILPKKTKKHIPQILWDETPNYRDAQDFHFDESERSGIDCTQAGFMLNYSMNTECLMTFSEEDSISVLMNTTIVQDTFVVGTIVYNENIDKDDIARTVIGLAQSERLDRIELPLLGAGQKELVDAIQDLSGAAVQTRTLKIYRKYT